MNAAAAILHAALAFTISQAPSPAEPIVLTGQIRTGVHKVTMSAGKLYRIRVEGIRSRFAQIEIEPKCPCTYFESEGRHDRYCVPAATGEYCIRIANGVGTEKESIADYTLRVEPIAMAKEPIRIEKSRIVADDLPYKNKELDQTRSEDEKRRHKSFTVALKAKTVYVIEMTRPESSPLNPWLHLENSAGNLVASSSLEDVTDQVSSTPMEGVTVIDGKAKPAKVTARVIHEAETDGEYRIAAAAYSDGVGAFELRVFAQSPERDKGVVEKGQVRAGLHAVKLTADHLYRIRLESELSRPTLSIHPWCMRFGDSHEDESGGGYQEAYCFPATTGEHRIEVARSFFRFGPDSDKYTLRIAPIPLAKKPHLAVKQSLALTDPVFEMFGEKYPHKAFSVRLKAGEYCTFVMTRGDASSKLEPALFIKDPQGHPAGDGSAHTVDGVVQHFAHVVIRARDDGDYRILATSVGDAFGTFELKVRKQAE
jgi:hypothetical protein